MIRAAFEKFGAWWTGTAWPAFSGAYANHELVRHAVTAAVAAFLVKVFW